MIPVDYMEDGTASTHRHNESIMCNHSSLFPGDIYFDPTDYRTRSDKPQLAYEIYHRLLTLATAAAAAVTTTVTSPINQRDILIAAYTGANLHYQR